jgi:hypothetical protein
MSDLYAEFNRASSAAINDWIRNFVLPYGSAYTQARTSFMDKLDKQKKADEARKKRIAELAMTALSLCGGNLLTQVFGAAALKTVAADIAVDVIAKREMNRAFKVAAFINENKTAQFALGKLWDSSADFLSNAVKKELEENSANFPALAEFAKEPQILQNHLEKWVRDAYAKVLAVEKDISKNIADEKKKTKAISDLLDAPFIRTAPKNSLGSSRTAEEMEFTFYMKVILDLDHLAKGHYYTRYMKGDNWEYSQIDSKEKISENPSSGSYPTAKRNGKDFEAVVYDAFGGILRDRVDELAKARFKAPFFAPKETISHSTLLRAESKLAELSNMNLETIKRSFSAPPVVMRDGRVLTRHSLRTDGDQQPVLPR